MRKAFTITIEAPDGTEGITEAILAAALNLPEDYGDLDWDVSVAAAPVSLDALLAFLAQNEATMVAALGGYASFLREEAAALRSRHEAIIGDNEAHEQQDRTLLTTNGVFQSARAMSEAAGRAERTLGAFQDLCARLEDEETGS